MGANLSFLRKRKNDMAICLVIFNPNNSKRIIMNYLYTIEQFHLQGLPTYTLELVYEGRKPEISSSKNVFHVTTNSYMFHKENMIRVLEKKIPSKYKKLLCVDADVIWKRETWYSDISKALDTYDVVQPFERAHWLDLTYKNTELMRETVLHLKDETWNAKYHPGFGWAFRRDWYNSCGFFDYAVSGSGDTLSVGHWLSKKFPKNFKSLPNPMKFQYSKFCKNKPPKIGYCEDLDIYHLYHGSRTNRQYVDRHKMIDVNEDILRLTTKNKDGILEWRDTEHWNPIFLNYFESREDDGNS